MLERIGKIICWLPSELQQTYLKDTITVDIDPDTLVKIINSSILNSTLIINLTIIFRFKMVYP